LIIHQSTVNRLSVHGPQENVLTFTSQLKLSPTLTLGCSGNAVRAERARAPVTPWVRLQWECRSCERALAPVAPRRVITRGDRPEGYPSTSRYLDVDCRSLRQFRQTSPFFVNAPGTSKTCKSAGKVHPLTHAHHTYIFSTIIILLVLFIPNTIVRYGLTLD